MMNRRVHRPDEKEKIFKALTEGEHGIFETFKDVMMTAACLGFMLGKKQPVSKRGKEVPWSVFSGQSDLPIINAIALMDTQDVNILLDDDETFKRKIEIFEAYANGGLDVLEHKILKSPGSALDNMIGLIHEYQGGLGSDDLMDDSVKLVEGLF